jgi:pilus assembly protein Flp/PilA
VTRFETLRRTTSTKRGEMPQLASLEKRCSVREDAMTMLITYVQSFMNQEDGQDLLEYALLVALIALVAIGAVGLAGGSVSAIFGNIAGRLTAAVPAS